MEYVLPWPGKRFRVFNFANINFTNFSSLWLLCESLFFRGGSFATPRTHRLDYLIVLCSVVIDGKRYMFSGCASVENYYDFIGHVLTFFVKDI